MIILGAHRISRGSFDAHVCGRISANNGILVGATSHYGSGVYAYYPDKIPVRYRGSPFVIFQPNYVRGKMVLQDIYIDNQPVGSDGRFFVLPGSQGSIISVSILGFVNCPGFPVYSGTLAYI